jgi:hypothetical protein
MISPVSQKAVRMTQHHPLSQLLERDLLAFDHLNGGTLAGC